MVFVPTGGVVAMIAAAAMQNSLRIQENQRRIQAEEARRVKDRAAKEKGKR